MHRVVAGYVTVPTQTGEGRAWIDVPCGAILPADVPQEVRDALLRDGHIESCELGLVAQPWRDDAADDRAREAGGECVECGDSLCVGLPAHVPDGSVMAVLGWVEGDPDRARAALDVEGAQEQPRVTLVRALHELI